jgi:Flp pilus assembly protein TadG
VTLRFHLRNSPSASRRNDSLKAKVREGHDFQSCRKCQRMNAASSRWGSLFVFKEPARPWRDDRAAQIVEFAVSLPLLLVFVVGIFDFSGAFTLKQKLTDAARDAARGAAADPANDLSVSTPVSVRDAFQIVGNYLTANNINDCGIATATPSPSSPLIWTYSGTGTGCTGTGLTINRGYYFPANSTTASADCTTPQPVSGQTAVLATCVAIHYAYPWRFNRVVTLLGSRASLPVSITATAVAMNEN